MKISILDRIRLIFGNERGELVVKDRPKPDIKRDSRGYERRLFGADHIQVRAAEEGAEDDSIGFEGHAAVFDTEAEIVGWSGRVLWVETIKKGAFKKTIKEADVRFLQNHNPDYLLARNKAKTLRLSEDDIGLKVDADMAPTSYAKDLAIILERGDINQMSFAFEVIKEEWDYDSDPWQRRLIELKLWDVAVVTYPAYTETDAALRSAGFDKLCASMEIDDEHRGKLLESLVFGKTDTDLAPTLEAAGEALQRMARAGEPVTSHSAEALRLRHRTIGELYGLATSKT